MVPGAFYATLAQQQFGQGNYGAAAVYGVASLVDAAIGVLTLGESTQLGTAVRATENAVRGFTLPEGRQNFGKRSPLLNRAGLQWQSD